jgi:hypothetical protein
LLQQKDPEEEDESHTTVILGLDLFGWIFGHPGPHHGPHHDPPATTASATPLKMIIQNQRRV